MSKKKAKKKSVQKKAAKKKAAPVSEPPEAQAPIEPGPSDVVLIAAAAAHEANRLYCIKIGDNSQPIWEDAPDWQKESALSGVKQIQAKPDMTPEESHAGWLHQKLQEGWKYGQVKDVDKKEHPCMVSYNDLPEEQRAKDDIFGRVVRGSLGIAEAVVADAMNDETGKPLDDVLKDQAEGLDIDMAKLADVHDVLDPELIARAKNYGFSDQQIKTYTTNGALQAACDRCTPPLVVTGREGKPEPKPRQHRPNQIPEGCKDYPIHLQAITERARIQTRNRLAYDHGVAQSCVLSFVRAHRQEGQVFCKKIVYSQDNQPNKNGELVTDIDIVMAV